MNCIKCKYFRILQEPIRGFDAGKAKCDKYNLYVDFMSHTRLNKLTCKDRPKTEEEKLSGYVSRADVLDAFGHGNTYTSEEIQEIVRRLPSENVKRDMFDLEEIKEIADYLLVYYHSHFVDKEYKIDERPNIRGFW